MVARTNFDGLPEELKIPLQKTDFIIRSFLAGVNFIATNAARDPDFKDNHLLTYIFFDYLQSALAITMLTTEGLLSVAKREIRFLIETSIKICYVQQKNYNSSIQDKIMDYERIFDSHKISIKKNIKLDMLPENFRSQFSGEVGTNYHDTSSYVHLTLKQINERMQSVDDGRIPGKESPQDIENLNLLLSKSLACCLVLLFHSVPDYVAGDWFVEEDGSTNEWYFLKSRYIAQIDSHFDYKGERQDRLKEVQELRQKKIEF